MQLVPQRTSLVAETAGVLRQAIASGQWDGFLPGELSLCERLQVSRATLRAALEQLEREGWCRAGQGRRRRIQRLGVAGTGPASSKVVLLSPLSLEKLSASAIFWVDALRARLAAVGYDLDIIASRAAFSRRPARTLETLLRQLHPAGWVLYLSTAHQQRWFAERGLPCTVSGSCHQGIRLPSVDLDYAAICEHAVNMLKARGRRQLAFLMPRSGQAGNMESARGFLDQCGRVPEAHGQMAHHDGSVAGICHALDRLLQGPQRVDGLLVAKPAHVVTALTHLLRRGVRLPAELSLVSRDDDPLLQHLVPVVSRYHLDPRVFARKISEVVRKLVRTHVLPRKQARLMPSLIRGETLG